MKWGKRKLPTSRGHFAPQPMPGWHLNVPATHLDKPLVVTFRNTILKWQHLYSDDDMSKNPKITAVLTALPFGGTILVVG